MMTFARPLAKKPLARIVLIDTFLALAPMRRFVAILSMNSSLGKLCDGITHAYEEVGAVRSVFEEVFVEIIIL